MNKNNINLMVYSPTPESGINTSLSLYYFYSYFFLAKKIYMHVRKINLFLFIYLLTYVHVRKIKKYVNA
jgi:hypothetical protein